jgi:hypothetical protein
LRALEGSEPRAAGFSRALADEPAARAGLAGGVMRLTVGREAAAEDGFAAGLPAAGPNLLCVVGLTEGPRALERLRKPLAGILAMFWATGNECCSVLADAAVSPLWDVANLGMAAMPWFP